MSLRLDKLPDRTPVRMSLSLAPALAEALNDYAEVYLQIYGEKEKLEVLIPAMLESFLGSDAGFKRARKALNASTKG